VVEAVVGPAPAKGERPANLPLLAWEAMLRHPEPQALFMQKVSVFVQDGIPSRDDASKPKIATRAELAGSAAPAIRNPSPGRRK
jgi:hypothetical protein